MFLQFYNLREQPFGVTPDPRFLYFASTHREALASMLYSIEAKRGFSALVAEPGMGKTSLLLGILDTLQDTARTAFLFQTEGDSREFLRSMLHDLGIDVKGEDPISLREALNNSLLSELRAGKQIVVVIDEAQNLDAKVLETVRLLSNFETPKQKLMHIILAGQPALATKLSDPSMKQLRQRVATLLRLEPFQCEEVTEYVNHRVRVAGRDGPPLFTRDALEMITRASQGIPRNINSLCFQALSIGYATQSKQIGAEILRAVMPDFDFGPRTSAASTRQEPVAWPPPQFDHGVVRDNPPLGGWEQMASLSPRPSRLKWVAAIACMALVPAAIAAMSDSHFGLTNTLPGQFSEGVVDAVLGWTYPEAEFVPSWPDKLKPPKPPSSTEAQIDSFSPSSSSSDSSTLPGDDRSTALPSTSTGLREAPTLPSLRQTPRLSRASQGRTNPAAEKERTFIGGEIRRGPAGVNDGPSSIQVDRSETLFQLAVSVYGHSNWIIVEALCASNPEIHDPYSILKVGQRVRLPSDLVTAKADYNPHGVIARPR